MAFVNSKTLILTSLTLSSLFLASNSFAASNSQGTIWDFEQYSPSPKTISQFETANLYSEVYPIEASPEALQAAISQFYDHGEPPSDKLLALVKDSTLYLQINGKEYTLKRSKNSIVRTDGTELTSYANCDYPLQDDERSEVFTNTKEKLTIELHTLTEQYYAMAYSPAHEGYRELKLPQECAQTQRYNAFSKGYAKLFKDNVLKSTITILRQDLHNRNSSLEN